MMKIYLVDFALRYLQYLHQGQKKSLAKPVKSSSLTGILLILKSSKGLSSEDKYLDLLKFLHQLSKQSIETYTDKGFLRHRTTPYSEKGSHASVRNALTNLVRRQIEQLQKDRQTKLLKQLPDLTGEKTTAPTNVEPYYTQHL